MTRLIFHITTAPEWDAARGVGEYRAPSLDTEGFIHCSLPTQVNHVADWFYRDVPDLVLLCVDPAQLTLERQRLTLLRTPDVIPDEACWFVLPEVRERLASVVADQGC